MYQRKITYSFLGILLLFSLSLPWLTFSSDRDKLTVNFLDVGQGDAILISQGSSQILIDGGASGEAIMSKLGKYVPFWDRKIEFVIATHPDQDHIGGLINVLKNYQIGEVIDNGVQVDSPVYQKYRELIESNHIKREEGDLGMAIKLPSGAELKMLNPTGLQDKDNPKETNDESVVTQLTYGKNSFLFTGDITSNEEAVLMGENLVLESRILKVAHHGSKYSTSSEFLGKVNPEDAVISVGKDNRYGHPNQEVLDRLKADNIKILRTDQKGDIVYACPDKSSQCNLDL